MGKRFKELVELSKTDSKLVKVEKGSVSQEDLSMLEGFGLSCKIGSGQKFDKGSSNKSKKSKTKIELSPVSMTKSEKIEKLSNDEFIPFLL